MSTRETRRREQTQQRWATVRSAITTSVAGLGEGELEEILSAARATTGIPLRELAEHLQAHPDALLSASPEGPKVLFRVLGLLEAAGHTVALPRCTSCGKQTADLTRFAESGRICQACGARNNRHDCDRCGRPQTRIAARRAEGRICYSCYRTDPERIEPCARCGRQQHAVVRLDDGGALCFLCWNPPQHRCARCGRTGQAFFIGDDGPLCETCYRHHQRPRALCGRCGRTRIVGLRGKNGQLDLCESCHVGPSATCSRCARDRPGHRTEDGEWICKGCTPRILRTCARCARSRPVHAHLPLGPVCSPCHSHLHDNPARCPGCRDTRVLIGHDDRGAICGPCAGSLVDPRCHTCGQPGRHHTGEKCARCVLAARLDDLLAGPDGDLHPQLKSARQLLLATDRPAGLLDWLSRSTTAHFLHELARGGNLITHDQLDALPQGRHELFLRQLLVQAGVLRARDDDLERIPRWLDTLLADQPEHRSRLIRPFTHWFVLRRARRSAARRRHPASASTDARKRIRVALEFLTWLDTIGIDLASADQAVLDRWLAEGNTRSRDIRYFLSWARSHRLVHDLRMPTRARAQPENWLDDTTRWQLLERSLHDISQLLDTRAAAALILLFGLTITRVRHLTTDQLQQQSDQTYLVTGAHRVLLPPKLAETLRELAAGAHGRSRYQPDRSTPRWLFPGLTPGRPLSATGLGLKLSNFGMHARPARNAALAALAAELPPAVLADLLGLHHETATRWARLAARDWHAFVATHHRNTAATE